ncbi:hypothetical protein L2750_19850 [Shewanella submarina]|uniref:DUF6882 domain-containing protein n=1 Tax=Shewanella submarina TaxID=2016376 RepID=A0ABV7GAM1_9GAMM|nr:DUF6882 domain-containing protein [Shewanella submarina]MCL1039380.1 hypothetical protein [Shewanella submarina]
MFESILKFNVCRMLANQYALQDFTENSAWRINLEQGKLSFANGASFDFDVLGSESFQSNTWVWSWANSSLGLNQADMTKAEAIRIAGEEHGMEYMTTPRFSLEYVKPHHIAMVSASMTGDLCYFVATHEHGALYLLLRGLPADMEMASEERIMMVIGEAIQDYPFGHKEMVLPFLESQGYALSKLGDRINAVKDDVALALIFDGQERLQKIQSSDDVQSPTTPWWKFWV